MSADCASATPQTDDRGDVASDELRQQLVKAGSSSCLRGRREAQGGAGGLPPRRLSWKDSREAEVVRIGTLNALASGGLPLVAEAPGDRAVLGDVNGKGGAVHERNGTARGATFEIDDRRSAPSEADHGHIISTFQQNLASVDSVIVYDNGPLPPCIS